MTNIKDRKFGRLEQFDERSKDFRLSISRETRKNLRSYTWKLNTVLDQGSEGSCVGHGWSHALLASPAPISGINHDFAIELYYNAQRLDPWEGGAYPGALKSYEGTSVLAGAKAAMLTGYITGYNWTFNLNDCLYGIGHHGPAILGIKWYEGMRTPDKNNQIYPTGRLLGGHCIIANAINVHTKKVTLTNSWGKDWGFNGQCVISFDDLEKLLLDNGECCFITSKRTKTDVPEED